MIKPIFTEKSLKLAKEGKYSFWIEKGRTKGAIKAEIGKLFGVHVLVIRTITTKGETGRNMRGAKYLKAGARKAIVTLKEKEKIDLFEESKSK